MTDYGLTDTGFVRKTYPDIVSTFESKQRSFISPTLRLDETTFLGNLNSIVAEELDALWEGLEAVVGALDPDEADGVLLTGACKLTGVVQEGESYGEVVMTISFAQTRTIAAGGLTVAHSGDATNLWTNVATIVGTAGQDADPALFRSVNPGSAASAGAGTLTVIVSGGGGVSAVTNPADATPGTDVETLDELRLRRERSLNRAGKATTLAIQTAILTGDDGLSGVPGVQDCAVVENETDVTDGNGVPPHSVHTLIWDGVGEDAADEEIAQAIFDAKAGGVLTYGTVDTIITDAFGAAKHVYFSRRQGVEITIAITVDGVVAEADVKAALLTYAPESTTIVWSKLLALAADVDGVDDVTALTIDRGYGPVSGNVTVGVDEQALFDASRITVTVT